MLHLSFLRSVWIEGEGEGMEESRVKLAEKKKKNLSQIYSTLLYSPSIQTDHKN